MTRLDDDPLFRDWVARARSVGVLAEAERRGLKLSRGSERTGPCPVCGGRDRFAINPKKGVFLCRGVAGGDVIAMVRHLDGCDFLAACERLAGPAPDSRVLTPAERAAADARERARVAEEAKKAEARRAEAERYRERERRSLYEGVWLRARPIAGTMAERYLAARGVPMLPVGAPLRFHAALPYWHGEEPDPERPGKTRPRKIATGPALLAAVTGPDGKFRGLEPQWLMERDGVAGKAEFGVDERGEALASRKGRGSVMGGRIVLRRAAEPARRVFLGEGVVTVLSVWYAMARAGRLKPDDLFLSALSLGNLAGRAVESVRHPKLLDRGGRALRVPGPEPDMASPAVPLPAEAQEIVLLGDGDSEPFLTRLALERAAARILRAAEAAGRPAPLVRAAMADADRDFNDMVREVAA